MNKTAEQPKALKDKALATFEMLLLILCLSITVIRLTITELPWPQSSDELPNQEPAVYSLILSAIMIASFVIWFAFSVFNGRLLYRFTGIEIGIAIFIIASVISSLAASNVRAAITNSSILIAPMIMTLLLIQLLDSNYKIMLTLTVIAAAGFVCAYQCSEQFLDSNENLIKQYEQNPQQMLEPLGIEPGTINHFQLEHRLYSKDIKGDFTTGNSAGSFLILAGFCSLAVFIQKIKLSKQSNEDSWDIITAGIVFAAILLSLILTHSKGAISAAIISAAIFMLLCLFGKWFDNHKKIILIVCLIAAAIIGYAVTSYGLSHNTLPGGKSMLARWQYWQATGKIYADTPVTGIGAGNFRTQYLKYKPPETLETINDPHNFLLSILTQFGPLGLAAFLLVITIPVWRIPVTQSPETIKEGQNPAGLKKLIIISLPLFMLITRPLINILPDDVSLIESLTGYLLLFVIPVVVFIIGFLMLRPQDLAPRQYTLNKTNVIKAALLAAVIGLLVHNLIDLAIFEGSVLTAFFVVLACLIAYDFNTSNKTALQCQSSQLLKGATLLVSLFVLAGFIHYVLMPVSRSISDIKTAERLFNRGQPKESYSFLNRAVEEDPLSSFAPSVMGDFSISDYITGPNPQPELLNQAQTSFALAIERNPNNYKNYEKLGGVYLLFSEFIPSERPEKQATLTVAFNTIAKAVKLNPGSEKLYFALGQIAEQLGESEIAIENYKKAVEIEDAFRSYFQQMYPDWETISRLGEENYKEAKQKIQSLSEQLNNP